MWLTKIFTALMVMLAGLVPSSCSSTKGKSPVAQQHAPAVTETATATNDKNLGELDMTNDYETCVQLGAGESCRITPKAVDRGDLQLTVALESKNSDGETDGLSVVQVVAKSGKPFEVAVGDMNLTLTPKLAEE